MVTAGMINEKVMGSRPKKFLKSAWFIRKKGVKKSHPVTSRKTPMTMYAMGEIK
jgi:hypothetical protein